MSADPALRSLPYWEAIEPVPAADEPRFGDGSVDARIQRCDAAMAMGRLWTPELDRMHEMSTWHAHEEINLLAIDCSTMYFDTLAPDAHLARRTTGTGTRRRTTRYLKTVLQVLQFLRGGDRWILKSPQHLEQFGPLTTVFPDATVLVTHRDPGDVLVSDGHDGRLHVTDAPGRRRPGGHRPATGPICSPTCSTPASRDRELLPADRSIGRPLRRLHGRRAGHGRARIYELADQPLDVRARAAHDGYLAATAATATAASSTTWPTSGSTPSEPGPRSSAYCRPLRGRHSSAGPGPCQERRHRDHLGGGAVRRGRGEEPPEPDEAVAVALGRRPSWARPGRARDTTIRHEPSGLVARTCVAVDGRRRVVVVVVGVQERVPQAQVPEHAVRRAALDHQRLVLGQVEAAHGVGGVAGRPPEGLLRAPGTARPRCWGRASTTGTMAAWSRSQVERGAEPAGQVVVGRAPAVAGVADRLDVPLACAGRSPARPGSRG